MKKCVIFCKHAIAKTLINQVVIDTEGCDKHKIEAFVKSFNLIRLKTNFPKFSTSKSFKIILYFCFFIFYFFLNYYFSPRMLQSVCLTFSSSGVGIDNSTQGIRPATHPLFVFSLCLTEFATGWGYWGLLVYILHVLRVPLLKAPKVGGSLDQQRCQSVWVPGHPASVGDAGCPYSVLDGGDT
jgi:hypothetical protein